MGTNIHVVIQKLICEKWIDVKLKYPRHKRIIETLNPRDYELFYYLSGIAGRQQPEWWNTYISKPRGLPDNLMLWDYDKVTSKDCRDWGDAGYWGHSWLLFSDIFSFTWPERKYRFSFVEVLKRIGRKNPTAYRLLFAFDS